MNTLTRKLLRSGWGLGLMAMPLVAPAQESAGTTPPPTTTTPASPDGKAGSDVVTLEKFIVKESDAQPLDSLMPTDRPVGGAFLGQVNVLELPRSVTILSPEAMKQFSVESFSDLDRVGAGLSRPNIFGIPGLPFIRGDNASVFYNGIMRISNQNETPTSFGSFESMEIHKGPAPAQFSPTNAGGYVEAIPKTPYFDRLRGSLEVTVGKYDSYKAQADVGGPVEILGKPMAYRVSITGQDAKSYYENVKNDYVSVYGALKGQLTPKLSFFTGGEYYNFKSNENAGWNRVTQDLVDNGNYVIGTADPNLLATSGPYAGYADVSTIGDFITDQNSAALGTYNPDLALVVPAAAFQAVYGAPPNPDGSYATGPASQMTLVNNGGSLYGYKYTPGYFSAGGTAITKKIDGDTVLSDSNDYANSQVGVWFGDFIWQGDDRKVVLKSYVEKMDTEKVSSYGFAHFSDGYAVNEKLLIEEAHDIGPIPFAFQYGLDWRQTEVNDANDFAYEPFSRRDITESEINPWDIVLTGPDADWAFIDGQKSVLNQYGLFLQTKADFTKYVTVYAGARHELAKFKVRPTADEQPGTAPWAKGDEEYQSYSLNPVIKITRWWSVYGALQEGIALQPNQTGGVTDERNFIDAPFREIGTKFSLFENKLFLSLSTYRFEKTVFSNTIIGSSESAYESKGYEFEATYRPVERFTIIGSFGDQKSKYKNGFPFTTVPMTEEQVALNSGAIQYDVINPEDVRYANNPDAERAGYPQFTANLFMIYEFENGFGVGAGPQYKSSFYNDNEHTIKLPDALIWNANVFYRGKTWEAFLRLNNITSEEYFIGSSFAPTMIVTKAEPFNWEVSVKYKF